jgi:GTP-binding protein HflX
LAAIEDRLARGRPELELTLDASDGQGLHWLYEHAEVMRRSDDEGRLHLTIRVAPNQIDRVKRRFALTRSLVR